MALFVLHKLILQTRMRSHPVGLDVWLLVRSFVYFHTSCVQTVQALARLRGCAGSPEPLLVAFVLSTIISWAGSNVLYSIMMPSILCIHQPVSISNRKISIIFASEYIDWTMRSLATETPNRCVCYPWWAPLFSASLNLPITSMSTQTADFKHSMTLISWNNFVDTTKKLSQEPCVLGLLSLSHVSTIFLSDQMNMSRLMTKTTKWLCAQRRLRSNWASAQSDQKTQINLGICPVWSESSLSARRKLGSLATHWAHSEDSDQTGRMPRLIWVFAGRQSFCWFCH